MKKLIVNPKKKETEGAKGLGFGEVFGNLFLKVYQSEVNSFRPLITKDGNTRRFIANVEPKLISIQDYAGKSLKSAEEAVDYLMSMGEKIYGEADWGYRLIVNEVKYGRDPVYFMETSNEELVKKVAEALEGIAVVEYNRVKKKNDRSETVTEPDTTETTKAQKGQEKENE